MLACYFVNLYLRIYVWRTFCFKKALDWYHITGIVWRTNPQASWLIANKSWSRKFTGQPLTTIRIWYTPAMYTSVPKASTIQYENNIDKWKVFQYSFMLTNVQATVRYGQEKGSFWAVEDHVHGIPSSTWRKIELKGLGVLLTRWMRFSTLTWWVERKYLLSNSVN